MAAVGVRRGDRLVRLQVGGAGGEAAQGGAATIGALVIVVLFFWCLARECRIAERRAWMTEEAERALRHREKANASRLRSTGVQ